MAKSTQDKRPLSVTTPLGKDKLLLESIEGEEALSELFQFQLRMLAQPNYTLPFDELLGKSVTVKIEFVSTGGAKTRWINGVVVGLREGHLVQSAQNEPAFTQYVADIVPQVWLRTKVTQSRIFQQKSVPDILKEVFEPHQDIVTYKLTGEYEPRNFCVQYRESDFAFASRLMEEEGIFYYFEHEDGKHKMVVGDAASAHLDVPGGENVKTALFRPRDSLSPTRGIDTLNRVSVWEKGQEIRSGTFVHWDHHFEDPKKNLEHKAAMKRTVKAGKVSHKLAVAGNDKLEIYDYPGRFAQRFDGVDPGGGVQQDQLSKIPRDSERTATIRIEQETAPGLFVAGQSFCPQFVSGHKFTLKEHETAADGDYLLTRVRHRASLEGAYTSNVAAHLSYTNDFECIPADMTFRPTAATERPVISGVQTAVVVGPSGQEIFTDKYGRVKVQFHWDRAGKMDEKSSCWIRVATSWAGSQWGMVHIPRIGQEVVVDFLEGDPDQPIVVGSVFNADQMPPYFLGSGDGKSANPTQSGLKTHSTKTKEGDHEKFNELRFEDKQGSEEIYFHAEKDFHRVVENNDTLKVGGNKADDGSQTIDIYKNRTIKIQTGDETFDIEKGQRTVTIHKGDDALTIKAGNRTVLVKAGKQSTEAAKEILLKVGGSSIKIDQQGIAIKAMKVSVEAEMKAEVKAVMADINASGVLALKGGVIKIN